MFWALTAILLTAMQTPRHDTVVSTEWLARHLNDPNVVIVEVREEGALTAGIPSSRVLPLGDIVVAKGSIRDEMPPVRRLREVLGNASIGDRGRIVLYSHSPLAATRAWFTLDYLGQGDRTSILDGGIAKWIREKRPVTTHRVHYLPQTFTPYPRPELLASMEQVQHFVNSVPDDVTLLDARMPAAYDGTKRGAGVLRAGHIPGAQCMPWTNNGMTAKNVWTLRDWQQLDDLYKSAGVKADGKVIVYCRTGMEASMPYFVLRSLGYDVALYDGSMNEWSHVGHNAVAR